MKAQRSLKGWWLICLMAGFAPQAGFAAGSGEISRAVEVAPPKGWTPDTPLFLEESSAAGRSAERGVSREGGAAQAPKSPRPAHRLAAAAAESPPAVRRTQKAGQPRSAAKASLKDAKAPKGATLAKANGPRTRVASATTKRREGRQARGVDKPDTRARATTAKRATQAGRTAPPEGKPAQTQRAAKRTARGAPSGKRDSGRRTGVKKG